MNKTLADFTRQPIHKDQLTRKPAFAILLSLVLILLAVWNNYNATKLSTADMAIGQHLNQLANDLRYYDEVLTMSAYMAAESNNLYWQDRYSQTVPKLDESIARAKIPATEKALNKLSEVNDQLIALETQLFSFLQQSKQHEALALIEGKNYGQLKRTYTATVKTLTAILKFESQQAIDRVNRREQYTRWLLWGLLASLVFILGSVARNQRKLQQQLVHKNQQLSSLVYYDSLTGIANRTLFMDRLEVALVESCRHKSIGALLIIDLDNFKIVNDTLGHPVGDKLLNIIASRLAQTCRRSDTVARLGGDEFAVIVKDVKQREKTAKLALKLTHTLQKPIVIEGSTITAQASIGIAIFPCDADQQDELLRKADLALYKAKALGKNTYVYFDADIETAANERQQLEQDIQQGLEKEEFEVFYQPLIDISKRQIFGVEALLRWRHPQRGMVSPADFIPAAEDSRLIIPMGNLVLEQACQQHKRWQENGLPALIMSVNLSAVRFENDSLFNDIKHILQSSAIDPSYLTLEITESTLMDSNSYLSSDKGAIYVLQQLNELGLKIAIDDFGTGYSSLAYLKRFPIHHLKIDRAFINGLPKDIEDVAITRAILNMSQALNLTVVAEGIETEEQLAFLQAEQCQYAQGFHLGRPMSAVQFEEFFLLSKEKYNVG